MRWAVLGAVVVAAAGCGSHGQHVRHVPAARAVRRPQAVLTRIGDSVRGRAIDAVHLGEGGRADLLVVGCIHGNEPAGSAVTKLLRQELAGREAWVIDDLNPDGRAAGTRVNAHGVDLNRNFPYRWTRLGARGTGEWSGPGPLSEPESRAVQRLILRVRPRISVWFHQPLGVTDESGGNLAIERRFSRLARLPLRRLTRYPGSVAGWENHVLPGATAFVVELPPGRLPRRAVARLARAVAALTP